MKRLRENVVAVSFVVVSFVVVAALYAQMPEKVPTHWNARGEVDGWMSKPWGPLFGPLVNLAVTPLLIALPAIAPKDGKIERFGGVYRTFVAAMSGFLLMLTLATSLAAIGHQFNMTNVICAGVGVLFAIIGNGLGKVTRNYFVGIRTPWTLANDEVWLRTHRLGGKLFVAAGLLTTVAALAGHGFVALMAGLVAAAAFSTAYSYFLYRRIA